jgi:hypothetical protein
MPQDQLLAVVFQQQLLRPRERVGQRVTHHG